MRRSADAAGKPWCKTTGTGLTVTVALGNHVSPAGGYSAGQVVDLNNDTTLPDQMPLAANAGVIAPAATGPIIDVTPVGDAAALQAAIDKAGTLKGQHPVLRVGAGNWKSDRGFTIPAGSDLILFGDNDRTRLSRSTAGAVLTIPADTPVTLDALDFGADGSGDKTINGIACAISDHPDAGIWGDQAQCTGREIGLDLGAGNNEFRSNESGGEKVGTRIRGGRTWSFGGATSNCPDEYEVLNGSTLVIRDTWYEGKPLTFLMLTGQGHMTLDGGQVAPGRSGPNGVLDPEAVGINMRNYAGSLSLIGVTCQADMRRTGDGKLLLLATSVMERSEWPFTDSDKGVVDLGCTYTGKTASGADGALPLPVLGADNKDDLVQLLSYTREAKPAPPRAKMVRLIRVTTQNSTNGLVADKP